VIIAYREKKYPTLTNFVIGAETPIGTEVKSDGSQGGGEESAEKSRDENKSRSNFEEMKRFFIVFNS